MNEIGITGEVVPHLLRSNDWVIGVLLCSFMIITYVFAQDKLSIYQRIRQFFFSHEHGEYSVFGFNDLLLILQCCLLCGLLLTFCYVQEPTPRYTGEHIFLLWVQYSGFALLYCMAKWIIYRFVNWVFFDKKGNNIWIKFINHRSRTIFWQISFYVINFIADIIHSFIYVYIHRKLHINHTASHRGR